MLAAQAEFNPDTYEYDDRFIPAKNISDFRQVHTVNEMVAHLTESGCTTEIEGVCLEADKAGNYRYRRIKNKEQFREAYKQGSRLKRFREADSFASDNTCGSNAGLVGDDFVPLLGGPFNKQPYLYDYLRAHAYCFNEYHHHPLAKAIVSITRDFVLGRGYRIDSDDPMALAKWRVFEQVNDLEHMIDQIVTEGSIYGENMIWWLPNSEMYIEYQLRPGQQGPKASIPRIRLIDPSTCWEIVTFPEDITRVLYYKVVFPTQYQIYTGTSGGNPVPTSKFITQDIPAGDVMHFKYNCVSNEKRGRSDLFPVLGYLKWIKDCVNYKLIALKKQAAWTEDIAVEGSQTDVDNLAKSLAALGAFEPAGSRFIHTSKVKREYMANQGGDHGDQTTLDWGLNMVAAGVQIPVTYFGMTHSAGSTRASAIVGTEPVAKKFERRQLEVKRILTALWRRFQDKYGVPGSECDIAFPEIITQDRSQKLKDIKFTEDCGYIARATAGPLAAKELDVDNYDYETEKETIASEEPAPLTPTLVTPLTAPSATSTNKPDQNKSAPAPSSSAITQKDTATISNRNKAGGGTG